MIPLTTENLQPEAVPRLNLNKERRRESITPLIRTAIQNCINGKARWPLLMFGPPGTGKTCAALSLCDYAPTAAYFTTEDLATRVMANNLCPKWLASKSLVVVDEIGERGRIGDLHYTALKRVLDARDNPKFASIYISNLPPAEIATLYDDRIASRLCAGTPLEVVADDRRLQRA